MTRAALAALLSHWRRHPGQLATLLLGIALATALFSAVQAINAEARASYAASEATLSPDTPDQLTAPAGRIPMQTFLDLRRAGWQVSPVWEGTTPEGLTVKGYDFLTLPMGSLPALAPTLAQMPPAALITLPPPAWAAPETLARAPKATPAPGLPPDTLITTIDGAMARAPSGAITHLLIAADTAQPLTRPKLETIAPGLTRTRPQGGAEIARLTRSFHLNLTAFGMLSFAVGLFIAYGAIGLAFEQRRPMFRTLRALGLSTRLLAALTLAELTAFALVAGSAGLALGHVTAAALLPDVSASLRGLYGAALPGQLAFRPAWAATGLAIALAGTLAAGTGSLLALARLPILASAKPRAWARASSRNLALQAAAGVALAAAGAAAVPLVGGLPGGFALLGGLLLGAALALPALLAALLAAAQGLARRPLSQWLWADARQQLPGLRLALMALLLALATNIGVGTMVSSFRLTFTGFLDQRLVSELYVTARSEEEATRLRTFLDTRPEVQATLPIWHVDIPLADQGTGELYGVADHATYRNNWPLLTAVPDAWNRLATGDAVMINEQLARRAALAPGDTFQLAPDWRAEIVATYSDYGNPAPQAITSTEALTARFPNVPKLRYGLRVAPSDVPALTAALTDTFGLPPTALVPNAEIKAYSLAIFERTFAVTAALNALTLGVAALAILTAMLTLSTMRLPQIAPVWAMGTTRARLAALEALRTLALAAFTALFALPLGLALAWALLAVVNTEAFGWRLPMFLFPGQWALLFATAIAAAALACAWPVIKLRRTQPSAFLKTFASER
ncbi:FtsX-like permease family protein [Oceanicola sp. 502str15]|uniref:FtsX-like permease family protein n=1 Tax=Oceanicola sp. 502str15 TaxID=2696061 RepID=UPI0020961608|nr:FtsX-like permease family protein [Oceanicola sp. 502str15]MCO6381291.1 FtsX-like permease family protein [Oceanicola sp. 502str15]